MSQNPSRQELQQEALSRAAGGQSLANWPAIIDGHVTNLIAAGLMFQFGTGPVKGFAVTMSLGIFTSMFTAIMVTRAMVNLIFGGRDFKKLWI